MTAIRNVTGSGALTPRTIRQHDRGLCQRVGGPAHLVAILQADREMSTSHLVPRSTRSIFERVLRWLGAASNSSRCSWGGFFREKNLALVIEIELDHGPRADSDADEDLAATQSRGKRTRLPMPNDHPSSVTLKSDVLSQNWLEARVL